MGIAIAGGCGGLAPLVCQVFALLYPAVLGNSQDLVRRAEGLIPQTTGGAIVLLAVCAAIFLISAGVVVVNTQPDEHVTFGKSFLMGVSVPGLVLSLANGDNLANLHRQPDNKPAPPPAAAATPLDVPGPTSQRFEDSAVARIRLVATPETSFTAATIEVAVSCPECSSSTDLSRLVSVIGVARSLRDRDAGAVLYVSLSGAGGKDNGKTFVRFPDAWTSVTVIIPHHENQPPNPQIWREQSVEIPTSGTPAGGTLAARLDVELRPGVFNSIRGLFAQQPYYVIEKLTFHNQTVS